MAHVLSPATLTRAVNDARPRRRLSVDDASRPTRSVLEDAFPTFVAPTPEVDTIVVG